MHKYIPHEISLQGRENKKFWFRGEKKKEGGAKKSLKLELLQLHVSASINNVLPVSSHFVNVLFIVKSRFLTSPKGDNLSFFFFAYQSF